MTHNTGLSFCHKNRLKNLIHLLTCGYLKTRSNIIIWHDTINNTITAHPSNANTPCSTEQLISTLATYKDRLAAKSDFGNPNYHPDCENLGFLGFLVEKTTETWNFF